jgi:hypothetical protein
MRYNILLTLTDIVSPVRSRKLSFCLPGICDVAWSVYVCFFLTQICTSIVLLSSLGWWGFCLEGAYDCTSCQLCLPRHIVVIHAPRGSENISLNPWILSKYWLFICAFMYPPGNHFGDIHNYSFLGWFAD